MDKRIEAAAKAICNLDADYNWDSIDKESIVAQLYYGSADASLKASDSVMFSDEAVERAAKALHDLGATAKTWDERDEDLKDLYREDARAVIAALRSEA